MKKLTISEQVLPKLFFSLLILIIITLLSSCGSTSETIHGTYGENFTMYISDHESKQITNEIAKCSVNVVLEKENDITNKNDYNYSKGFVRYSYSVNISGTIDVKYAGRNVKLYIVFIPEYHLAHNVTEGCIVSQNGTFSYTYTFNSNAILTEWTPFRVEL